MLDIETLRKCYALSRSWEKEFIANYKEVSNLTENEARILVHMYKNKGTYFNRIVRVLDIKRSTAYSILEKLKQQGVVFTTESPISGNRIYKLADSELTRAYIVSAFYLCISEHINSGVSWNDIFV
jgi:DNA-binding MarR family transcriptional regulator